MYIYKYLTVLTVSKLHYYEILKGKQLFLEFLFFNLRPFS